MPADGMVGKAAGNGVRIGKFSEPDNVLLFLPGFSLLKIFKFISRRYDRLSQMLGNSCLILYPVRVILQQCQKMVSLW